MILFVSIKLVSYVIVNFFKYYRVLALIILILLLLNYSWVVSYYFISLSNHYLHNLPWSLNGDSLRSLQFFLVDKRNFFFLVDFANKLSDYAGIIDEKFYLRLHNEFMSSLDHVFFKIDKGVSPIMYNSDKYLNKDTLLLQLIFKKYNQSMNFLQ